MCGNVDDNRKVWLSGVMNYIQLENWIWVVAQAVALSVSLLLCCSLSEKFGFNDRAKKNADFYAILHTFGSIFNYRTWYSVFFSLVACFFSFLSQLSSCLSSPSYALAVFLLRSQYVIRKVEKLQQKCTTHCNNEMWKHTHYIYARSCLFFCSVSHRFFAVALLSSFVFYRRRRHTNEACDIRSFLPNLTALIKCVLNKHFIRPFMYAWMCDCVCVFVRWFYQNSQLHEQWAHRHTHTKHTSIEL